MVLYNGVRFEGDSVSGLFAEDQRKAHDCENCEGMTRAMCLTVKHFVELLHKKCEESDAVHSIGLVSVATEKKADEPDWLLTDWSFPCTIGATQVNEMMTTTLGELEKAGRAPRRVCVGLAMDLLGDTGLWTCVVVGVSEDKPEAHVEAGMLFGEAVLDEKAGHWVPTDTTLGALVGSRIQETFFS